MKYKDITKYLSKTDLKIELTFVHVCKNIAYATDSYRAIKMNLPDDIVLDGFYTKNEWHEIAKGLDKVDYIVAHKKSKSYQPMQEQRDYTYVNLEKVFEFTANEELLGSLHLNCKQLCEFLSFCKNKTTGTISMQNIKVGERIIYYQGDNFEQVMSLSSY